MSEDKGILVFLFEIKEISSYQVRKGGPLVGE